MYDNEHCLSNHTESVGSHKTISSTGSHMLVNFVTDNDISHNGFSAKIHHITINPICKDWLNTTTRFLASPDYPTMDCSWVITASMGSTISIQFQEVEVKKIFREIC